MQWKNQGRYPRIEHQFETWRSWQSASLLHLLHAVALLGLAALSRLAGHRALGVAGLLMCAGIVLFSGSIYISILRETGGTAGLAPVGGVCLMASWLTLALAALRARGGPA